MKLIAIIGSLFFGVSVFSSEHTACQDTSLMAAFKASQCAKKVIIHHFAFAEENKSLFDKIFKKSDKIVDVDMLACSQQELSLMRHLQGSHREVVDFVISSLGIWQLDGKNWIRFPLGYEDIEIEEKQKNSYCQSIVVYNIADDTILSNQFHSMRIQHLLKQNASLIVNVAKNKWNNVLEDSLKCVMLSSV